MLQNIVILSILLFASCLALQQNVSKDECFGGWSWHVITSTLLPFVTSTLLPFVTSTEMERSHHGITEKQNKHPQHTDTNKGQISLIKPVFTINTGLEAV